MLSNRIKRCLAWSVGVGVFFALLPMAIVFILKPESDSWLTLVAGFLMMPGARLGYYAFHIGVHHGLLFLAGVIVLNWILFTGAAATLWSVVALLRPSGTSG